MRVYIFGPMVKYRNTDWNRARFTEVRDALIAAGHEVCSPMVVDDGLGGPEATGARFPLTWLLAYDLQIIGTCAAIVSVQDDWSDSKGSRVEALGAKTVGIPILQFPTLNPVPSEYVAAALLRCFDGDPVRPPLALVAEEHRRQFLKWGEQNHPDGTGLPGDVHLAALAKRRCDVNADQGRVTYRDILEEEVAEAMAETDPSALEKELIQVAAVATAWVECIRRRRPVRPMKGDHS